jgi:predicted lysophospholipase L1 biosynthesis ABC-type transport system permease subunit
MNRKPKYAGLGIALGAALGAVAGVMAGNMGVWLAIGVAIGLVIGLSSRRKAAECPECEAIHRAHEPRSRANSQVG